MTHPSRDIQACIEVLNRRAVEYGEKARKHEKTHGINTYRHGELNLYRKAYEDAAFAISKLKPTSPWLPIEEAPKHAIYDMPAESHKIEQGYYDGHISGFGGTVDAR